MKKNQKKPPTYPSKQPKVKYDNLDMLSIEDKPLPPYCLELEPYHEPIHEKTAVAIDLSESQKVSSFREGSLKSQQNWSSSNIKEQMDEEMRDQMEEEAIKDEANEEISFIGTNDLTQEYNDIVQIGNMCKLIESLVVEKSIESIYDYEIGFESEQEQQEKLFQTNKPSTKEQLNRKIQEEFQHKIDQPRFLLKQEHCDQPPYIHFQGGQSNSQIYEEVQELIFSDSVEIDIVMKLKYLTLRNDLSRIKKIVENNIKKAEQNDDHYCRICHRYFENGRQLGGHMSRKHPGNTVEHLNKKEVKNIKFVERQRRKYFRSLSFNNIE